MRRAGNEDAQQKQFRHVATVLVILIILIATDPAKYQQQQVSHTSGDAITFRNVAQRKFIATADRKSLVEVLPRGTSHLVLVSSAISQHPGYSTSDCRVASPAKWWVGQGVKQQTTIAALVGRAVIAV